MRLGVNRISEERTLLRRFIGKGSLFLRRNGKH